MLLGTHQKIFKSRTYTRMEDGHSHRWPKNKQAMKFANQVPVLVSYSIGNDNLGSLLTDHIDGQGDIVPRNFGKD